MVPQHIVAVVGATATGKSEAAVALAEALAGEVVSADAYQVYGGLDIGTAKTPPEMRARAPHHLIDITTPDRPLTLARYLDAAQATLADIWSRGRLPVLAGGSGQYVWALIEGWRVPRVPPDPALRRQLEEVAAAHGPEALHARLAEIDPEAARRLDPRNARRLVRALEVVTRTGRPLAECQTRAPVDADVLVIGLCCPRDELYRRTDVRVDSMFAAGLVDEVKGLRERGFGDSAPLRSAIGYKEVSAYLDGALTLSQAVEKTKTETHRLVRKQGAWFKATDSRIHWIEAGDAAPAACVALATAWLRA